MLQQFSNKPGTHISKTILNLDKVLSTDSRKPSVTIDKSVFSVVGSSEEDDDDKDNDDDDDRFDSSVEDQLEYTYALSFSFYRSLSLSLSLSVCIEQQNKKFCKTVTKFAKQIILKVTS
jgi:hypothetical protein